ncbi:MAG: hypothetical protein DI598_08430 [Pseudopedobacter saltans]|uniref:Lipoprotein n=1 Tax=Pseudopedobacter saltans TaxID=151895 RepID=A0A2W5F6F2_9SPHI|nr:MAG: hypothetical protein DI598_08430 [Pseudopedobacter saltans]
MKKIGLFWSMALLVVLASCGKKTIPVASNTNKPNVLPQSKTDPRVGPKHQKDSVEVYRPPVKTETDSTPPPVVSNNVYTKTFTVVDSHGRLLLDPEKTPADITPDWIALKGIRSFTPSQAQTMASRYNTVPPRVIYVPSGMEKTGRKGTYYIYSKKFWYWKKEDGLFYLDTNYYQ